MSAGKFPEQLVYARTNDDIVDAGVIFIPPKDSAKPVAVIWIHGWGVNFYSPTYVGIGRALSEKGYTAISANARMHDLGNVEGYEVTNGFEAAVIGVSPAINQETLPPGLTSLKLVNFRKSYWLGTAPAGLRSHNTKQKSATGESPISLWLLVQYIRRPHRPIRTRLP